MADVHTVPRGATRGFAQGDPRRIRPRTAPPAALISDFVASDHWRDGWTR
ncbi:hypothetical protein SBD_4492 [Streptomyces bottropensis ATCC 25435]|uniref:Uncharacterized protein n=1 Tax=Streptomyces bottropensis ATCC 25435 TaxID=1054862 RepID=M3FRN5_9ACTN|nr:hypothetical protein SBD_4492 [Streptomyces bottropensis ATCC 25435]